MNLIRHKLPKGGLGVAEQKGMAECDPSTGHNSDLQSARTGTLSL